MSRLDGKAAIVTGSSRAIGRAIAERLARDGASVVLNYARGEAEADEVVASIVAAGGAAVAVRADVSSVAGVVRLFDTAEEHFGRVDILVNNAAIYRQAPLADVTEDDYEAVFALNVRGVLFALREASRRLADGGRVVTISSDLSVHPDAEKAVYGASKAAVDHLTRVASQELGRRGITVNSVLPGPTVPGMFALAPEPVRRSAALRSPFGRLGTPRDIADVVAFLASDDARWVTGQVLLATGGG
jgi:3-oxoacyl-[acyl-carrier protein] reductase